jgi:hypothetical protein
MPSRSGENRTRRSAAHFAWRFSMLTGWCRSRQVRALARNRPATISPAGQPRTRFAASGSRKCASNACAPSEPRPLASSTMTRACCHEIVPASNADNVNGRDVVSSRASANRPTAAGSPTVSTPATSATKAISCAACSCKDIPGAAIASATPAHRATSRTFRAANRASSQRISAKASKHPSYSRRSRSAPAPGESKDPRPSERLRTRTSGATVEPATVAVPRTSTDSTPALLSIPTASQHPPPSGPKQGAYVDKWPPDEVQGRSAANPGHAGSSMAAAVPASINGPKGMADFSVPRRDASRASDQRPPSRKAAKVPANTCAQPR